MMVKILDCTLRDGGYVNDWQFDRKSWQNIVKALMTSGVDIIELGYLDRKSQGGADSSIFCDLQAPEKILGDLAPAGVKARFCLMVDLGKFSAGDLPPYQGQHISGIRLAFHKEQMAQAAEEARKMAAKGYHVYVQPMVTTAYTDADLKALADTFNPIDVVAVYIVDSFGLLFTKELVQLWKNLDQYLRPNLALGYHAHNNLQLAYANAIDMIEAVGPARELLIDASIFGMGRGAGNLNTELLMHYLNVKHAKNYDIVPLLECIDNPIEAIYRENAWGYSIAYFLSATLNCHPNYASYLLDKKTLSVVDIEKVLASIPDARRRIFSQECIEELYIASRSVKRATGKSPDEMLVSREIVAIASGPSIKAEAGNILERIRRKGELPVALNHVPALIPAGLFFFSNQKRYDEFHEQLDKAALIVTSNIELQPRHQGCFVVDYDALVNKTADRCDNVAVLLLNILVQLRVARVAVAGLDGYSMSAHENYSYPEMGRVIDKKALAEQNGAIAKALRQLAPKIQVEFLTPSLFKDGS